MKNLLAGLIFALSFVPAVTAQESPKDPFLSSPISPLILEMGNRARASMGFPPISAPSPIIPKGGYLPTVPPPEIEPNLYYEGWRPEPMRIYQFRTTILGKSGMPVTVTGQISTFGTEVQITVDPVFDPAPPPMSNQMPRIWIKRP